MDETVLPFIQQLYKSAAIRYATNHAQMEAWVALEGLEFFSSQGWASWETMGFITGAPVHAKTGIGGGIKFPDLVCVRGDVSLWWEFKAISRFTLHPKKAGGTFVQDIRALCKFRHDDTVRYLEQGHCSPYRTRDDSAYIGASGMQKKLCAAKKHVGVALLFSPGEDELVCPNPNLTKQHWRPTERIRKITDEVKMIECVDDISRRLETIGACESDASDERSGFDQGTFRKYLRPRCNGWVVSMASLV